VRINTKTQKIELLKFETETLARAKTMCRTLSKHADGDIERLAERISNDIGALTTALADQGKELEVAKPY
jgi:hypothetical protein